MCHLLCEYHQIKQAGVYLIFEQYCTPVSGLFMTPTRGIEAGFEHFPTLSLRLSRNAFVIAKRGMRNKSNLIFLAIFYLLSFYQLYISFIDHNCKLNQILLNKELMDAYALTQGSHYVSVFSQERWAILDLSYLYSVYINTWRSL